MTNDNSLVDGNNVAINYEDGSNRKIAADMEENGINLNENQKKSKHSRKWYSFCIPVRECKHNKRFTILKLRR